MLNKNLAVLMHRRHSFTAGDYDLRHFGGCILEPPKHTVAVRDIEFISSYGNADDIIDHGRYNTVDFDISVGFRRDLFSGTAAVQIQEIEAWLAALSTDYHFYADTYNKGWHTQAVLTAADPLVRTNVNLWETKLSFTRRPYWYSDSGAIEIPLPTNEDVVLENPSSLPSKPTIIWRNGSPGGKRYVFINGVRLSMNGTATAAETRFECEKLRYISIEPDGTIVHINEALPPDLLPKGAANTVKVSGRADFFIIPNWRRL